MSRESFWKMLGIKFLCLIGVAWCQIVVGAKPKLSEKPNIIVIVADDMVSKKNLVMIFLLKSYTFGQRDI